MKYLDQRTLERREVRDIRRLLSEMMPAEEGREMQVAIKHRRLGRWIFEEVAGREVMKIVLAEHSQRRWKIFLQHVEQAVEIHVRVDVDAILGGQTIVAAHNRIESAGRHPALRLEPLRDAASRGDQPIEQVLQLLQGDWHRDSANRAPRLLCYTCPLPPPPPPPPH